MYICIRDRRYFDSESKSYICKAGHNVAIGAQKVNLDCKCAVLSDEMTRAAFIALLIRISFSTGDSHLEEAALINFHLR